MEQRKPVRVVYEMMSLYRETDDLLPCFWSQLRELPSNGSHTVPAGTPDIAAYGLLVGLEHAPD